MDKRAVYAILASATILAMVFVDRRLRISKPETPKWQRGLFYTLCGSVFGLASELAVLGFDMHLFIAALILDTLGGAIAGFIVILIAT